MGWIWVPSPREGRLVPNRPAPGLPLCRGGLDPWGWGWGAVHRISCRVPAARFSQRHLPNSLHYYFTQGAPVLAWGAGKKPGGASEEKRGRGKGRGGSGGDTMQEVSRTPADTTPIPFPGQNPCNLLAFPCRFIPELTAGRPAEQDNQKQNEEDKSALGITHLSLCHLDPNFARVRGCQVRTCDPLPLGGSCGLDLRLCADCLGGPSADRPRPGFPLEASRQGLGWALLSAPSLTGLPSCKPAYPPVYPGRQRALVTGDRKLLFLQFS